MTTKTVPAAMLATTIALAACSTATPPPPAPAVAYMPPPVPTVVPLERSPNGGLVVQAKIDDVPMRFVLDSGADAIVLPAALAGPLVVLGVLTKDEFVGTGSSIMADGHQAATLRFKLHAVQIGNIVIHDADAVVIDSVGPPLLGQSVLSVLPALRIDNVKQTLEIG